MSIIPERSSHVITYGGSPEGAKNPETCGVVTIEALRSWTLPQTGLESTLPTDANGKQSDRFGCELRNGPGTRGRVRSRRRGGTKPHGKVVV
jgi:hypothetical protein